MYTYQSGLKKVSFKIDESLGLTDSFAPMGRFRRTVTLPGGSDEEEEVDDGSWKNFMEVMLDVINDVTPDKWDVTSMARSNRRTRLLRDRAYAKPEAFATENIANPPGLKDLSPPTRKDGEVFWITNLARLLAFGISYAVFPFITRVLDGFVTMPPEKLDDIASKFGPGISILYGTFISLTLSILYRRQQEIQDDAAIEASMLVLMTRNLMSLFRKDSALLEEAGQCSADQVRTLVKGSRGGELILLMYSDPYARMLELVDCYEEKLIAEGKTDLGGKSVSIAMEGKKIYGFETTLSHGLTSYSPVQSLISSCRDTLKDLFKLRANRLSNEAQSLPATHFFILVTLTGLILLTYTVSILPTVDSSGNPSNEASLIFGILSSVYVLFYNFASDLNYPFSGVYQVRRSATASHLLELKWLIAHHPVLRGKVDFEEAKDCDRLGGDVVVMRSPGLGDLLFAREDIYPDSPKVVNGGGEPKK